MRIEVDDRDVAHGVKHRTGHHPARLLSQPGEDHAGKERREVPPLEQHQGMAKRKKEGCPDTPPPHSNPENGSPPFKAFVEAGLKISPIEKLLGDCHKKQLIGDDRQRIRRPTVLS